MKRPSSKLTYANVVATLALFLVLAGGSAFAASQMLPKNSVGSKQIKKGAVTPVKLSTASKAKLTGPQGPKGEKGEHGEKGEAGPSTGPAGGALGGSYPNPTIATATRGIAIAGATSNGEDPPSTANWFNRLGGAPTISRTALGEYEVTFPGLNASVTTNAIAAGNGLNGDQVAVSSSGGSLYVYVRSPAGALQDGFFSVVLFGASSSG
jgi:hypothetical protein